MSGRLHRRALLSLSALAPLGALAPAAAALGRLPTGGKVALRAPLSTARIDPHDLFDPLAAYFGGAMADTVYARDVHGVVYPALADGMPTVEGDQTVVRLRPGLRTARGKPIGGRDLAWSVARARKLGASALFARVTPWVRSDKDDPLVARFGDVDPAALALVLCSPLCALLPVGFDPNKPDGTGAFLARPSPVALELIRNPNAARGPSQLEQVTVWRAPDLAASLKAFEAGIDDVGWQGMGFYGTRPEARPFDHRDVGWVVLVTGIGAGPLHAPGMAQRLADAVPIESLHVGLRGRPGASGGTPYNGGSASLLFDSGVPHLAEIAAVLAAKMSAGGGTVTPAPVSRATLRRQRASKSFAFALDVVRDPGPVPAGVLLALATADSAERGKEVAEKPPKVTSGPAHTLTRGLHVGVLGALAVRGGVIRPVALAADKRGLGIDWGATYRH